MIALTTARASESVKSRLYDAIEMIIDLYYLGQTTVVWHPTGAAT